MKDLFPGYYRLAKEALDEMWKNCVFVFDTSVLLGVYQYSPEASNELLKVLELIKDRIWIPFQVAKEFHTRKADVIEKESKKYSEVKKQLEDISNKLKSKNQHPFLNPAELSDYEGAVAKVYKALEREKSVIKAHLRNDILLDRISILFASKVGPELSDEEHKEICKQGEGRYAKNKPPGYEDRKKEGEEKYNDLIIWKEIIRKSKNDARDIIFITNDSKEDWWQICSEETIGPRPELLCEFAAETEHRFYMYHSDSFLDHTDKYFNRKIPSAIVNELKEKRIASEEENRKLFNSIRQRESNISDALGVLRNLNVASPYTDLLRVLSEQKNPMAEALSHLTKLNAVGQLFGNAKIGQLGAIADSTSLLAREIPRNYPNDLLKLSILDSHDKGNNKETVDSGTSVIEHEKNDPSPSEH